MSTLRHVRVFLAYVGATLGHMGMQLQYKSFVCRTCLDGIFKRWEIRSNSEKLSQYLSTLQHATAVGAQGRAWHFRNQVNTHFQWVSSLLQPSFTACASERERTDETAVLSFGVFSLNGLPKDAKHVPSRGLEGGAMVSLYPQQQRGTFFALERHQEGVPC